MSLDLFERETSERMQSMAPALQPNVGVFDGFIRGTGLYTMRELARTARAIDLLGSVGPIVQDAFTGGTEAQDKYFREHNEIWGSAVDHWTPKPMEVGAASEVAGSLLAFLRMVLTSPGLAVGTGILSPSEELVKKGVDWKPALATGLVQGAGLGLGVYMPIVGRTLTERVLAGGMGFNVAQGIGVRGASEAILSGTPGEGDFHAFDPTSMTLDALLGAAFGGLVHLSPTARAHGEEAWKRVSAWAQGLSPSDVDALAVLRQAQHMNADSMPGKPAEPVDVERHVARMRQALEQLVRNEPVAVSDLPAPRFEADEPRLKDMASRARELAGLAEDVRKSEGLAPPPEEPAAPPERAPVSEAPAAPRGGVTEPPPPRGSVAGEKAAGAEGIGDPLALEASRFAEERPDMMLRVGEEPNGAPILKTVKEYLGDAQRAAADARQDIGLFEAAAQCLLGRA